MAVYIIPGLNSGKNFYKPLADGLKRRGFNAEIIDLGRNIMSLDKTSGIVLDYLARTDETDDIIAHSFGGVVIKNIIAKNPEILKQIKSLSFIAVPHGGSWLTLFIPILPAARDMMPMRKHFKTLSNVPLPEKTVNFIAQTEYKIWPKKSSRLAGHIDIVISGTTHDSIIKSPELADKIVEFMRNCR